MLTSIYVQVPFTNHRRTTCLVAQRFPEGAKIYKVK